MKKNLFIFLIALAGPLKLYAQKLPEIDLGKDQKGDERTIDVDCTGFKIINRMPNGTYQFKISVQEFVQPIANVDLSAGAAAPVADAVCDPKMKDYLAAYDALNNPKDETVVAQAIKDLNNAKEKVIKDAKDCYDKSDKKADLLIAQTIDTRSFDFTLKKAQVITVTINRLDDNNVIKKTWTVVLKTPTRIDYISHFGFTFSPGIVKRPTQYFAKAGDDGKYTITEMNNNGRTIWNDLSLTANFIFPFWYQKHPDAPLHVAWMGGFGINGDTKFTVFTGPSLLLSDFFSVGLGFGVSNQYKLNGQYKPGDVIKDNLNFDQLHSKGLMGDILLTLSFRLSKTQLQAKDSTTDK